MDTNRTLSVEQQRAKRKSDARRKKEAVIKWKSEHPRWSSFTRNQKRNMRSRLKRR